MAYREKKVKAAAFSEFIVSFFFFHNSSFALLLVLTSSDFPFHSVLSQSSLWILIYDFKACDANFDQLHRPWKKPNQPNKKQAKLTTTKKLSNTPKYRPYVDMFFCQKRKVTKAPQKISGLVLCIWEYLESHLCAKGGNADADTSLTGDALRALYLAFPLEEILTIAYWKCASAKIQSLANGINQCGLAFRERTGHYKLSRNGYLLT